MKDVVIITLSLGILLTATWMIGKIVSSNRFSKQVKSLFSESGVIKDKIFQPNEVQNLPEPVKRYFRHVMKEGQPYISYVRLKHGGQFKTGQGKNWVEIEGEQYFTTQTPGFIWKGSTKMFTAKDMFLSGRGRLTVTLFSVLKIADAQGKQYDEGELMRWLAESVWFPTNLLPDDNLKWSSVDNEHADLTYTYGNKKINYRVTFNASGEITAFETKRYMNRNDLETWVGKVSDYKRLNDVLIPTAIEATYRLKTGDYSYARFTLKQIDYNVPELF